MKDQRSNNAAFEVKEAAAEQKGGLFDQSELVSGHNSGRSPGERAHYPLSWK